MLFALLPVHASVLVIGTADPGNGNSAPFGSTAVAGTTYQQVYAPSDFSGPIDITSVHFYRTQDDSPPNTLTGATYTIKLSTSLNPVNGLSTFYSTNVATDVKTLGIYTVSDGTVVGNELTFNENVSDFFYNPANGPLLLEIDLTNLSTRGTVFMDAMNGDAGGLFSRVEDFGRGPAYTNFGLVTGFDYVAPAPEPVTSVLIAGGFLALGLLRRRA